MFEHLLRDPALHGLLPFLRQWYGAQSEFRWASENWRSHVVFQGDGGEQGDALIPGLFCLAMQPALQAIQVRILPGAEVVAYLGDVHVTCDPEDAAFILENEKIELRNICHIDMHAGRLRIWGPTAYPVRVSQRPTGGRPGRSESGCAVSGTEE
eukprot:3002513-Pyramimonas_sp.AAC.1